MSESRKSHRMCVVIPAYREAGRIGAVVEQVRAHSEHVVVVDDGSPDATATEAEAAGAIVLRHEKNRGKGAALQTGFDYARDQGFDYVIAMDADGQHAPDDIPRFVKAYINTGLSVIVGTRMANPEGMPRIRRWTNSYMSWLLSRRMKQYVSDTQNGFRLYGCDLLDHVRSTSDRFAAESEVLLNLAEAGVRIGSVPVQSIYNDQRSKIRPVRDSWRFFRMLRRHDRNARAAYRRAAQEPGEATES